MYSGIFQWLLDMRSQWQTECRADLGIQLPSIKLDIKELGKNVKQCHSSHECF